MADRELIIKIPEKMYAQIIDENGIDTMLIPYKDIIKNGILLPKGHGDIIERNKIEYMKAIHDLKWGKITASECATKIINSAPTIIEADKE